MGLGKSYACPSSVEMAVATRNSNEVGREVVQNLLRELIQGIKIVHPKP